METPDKLLTLLDDIEAHLRWHQEAGHMILPVTGSAAPSPSPSAAPAPAPAPVAAPPTKAEALDAIARRMEAATVCGLQETATRIVPGQGNPDADLVFIGEGPGAEEDKSGLAFVGPAGQLLTNIIAAMGLSRDDVWIGNIVKWRPPNNRTPTPVEIDACLPYLVEQLAVIEPRVIVCLGATAAKGLLEVETGITRLRGTWMTFEGIDVMPTYHPAFLLRTPSGKKDVWADMQAVLKRLGLPVPKTG